MPGVAYYRYVSTRCGADPVRTVMLCVPGTSASCVAAVEAFARASGWIDEVEASGDVLLAPVMPDGWAAAEDPVRSTYLSARGSLRAPARVSLPGRDGLLWAWEPLVCVVGYGDGASSAAETLVAHPSFAASCVLVDGFPGDLSHGDNPSDHWHVAHPSSSSHKLNREVPVAAWLMGAACDEAFVSYLREAGGPDWRLRVSPELTGTDARLARKAMRDFICHVVRWKSSPDGTLAWRMSREEFYLGSRFAHACVESGGNAYHYAVHLPEGMRPKDAAGLPMVLSLHGRGEPSWLYADKNGWEGLADETREFVVVVPDSPRNVWSAERDADVLELIIDEVVAAYGCDRTRVYLTGFSNGAAFTCQQATTRPWLFAAASPWNCPPEGAIVASGLGPYLYAPDAQGQGYELPFWIVTGDSDDKGVTDRSGDLPTVLPLGGCAPRSEDVWDGASRYTAERGYTEGDRLRTRAFKNAEGSVRVGLTTVRDMPHGAIADEARAAWEFMRCFRRVEGSGTIREVGQCART